MSGTTTLLSAVSSNGTGTPFNTTALQNTLTLAVSVSGTVTAFSVQLQGSIDGTTYENIGGSVLSPTAGTNVSTGVQMQYFQAVLAGYAGTGTITCVLAYSLRGAAGGGGSSVPTPTAANQYPVSNSSDVWTLAAVGTVGGNSYNAGWTVGASDLGGEADYNSSSAGSATIPSGLTATVGATFAARQMGTGALTIAAGASVTVEGAAVTTGQYQTLLARQVATDTWAVTASVTGTAPLASPSLTGNPTAPTQVLSDSSTKLATTAFTASLGLAGNANQFGYLGWTLDPILAAGALRPQSGQLCLIRFRAAANGTIGHIVYSFLASGSGLTSAENWLGIYDTGQATAGSATLIGYTADQTSNFSASAGVYSAAIATGTPAVTAGLDYFAAFLSNGSARPQLTCGAVNVAQMPQVNQGLSGLSLRLANGNTTYTTLPASVTAANLSGSSLTTLAASCFVVTT
jgi:hypothetical protein